MNREHLDAKPARRPDRALNRIGNVVKFQIQEYFLAPVADFLDEARAFPSEDFKADFENPHVSRQALNGFESGLPVGDIQGYNQS
jgi:hypothetical protein